MPSMALPSRNPRRNPFSRSPLISTTTNKRCRPMSPNDLMPSTSRHDSSSAGASPTACIERCDPFRFHWPQTEEPPTRIWFPFPLPTERPENAAFFCCGLPCEGEQGTLAENAVHRLICHVL